MKGSHWRSGCAAIALGLVSACSSSETPEASTPPSGSDAGTDGEAGSHDGSAPAIDPFCATRPQLPFCEDFDAPSFSLPGRFAEKEEAIATLTADEQGSSSPPRALLVTTLAGVDPGRGLLRTPSLGPGRKFRLFAQARIDARASDAGASTEILALVFPGGYRLGVTTDGAGAWKAFQEGKTDASPGDVEVFPSTASTANVPDGDWTSIRFEVDVDESGRGRMTVKLGDVVAVERVPLAPPFSISTAVGAVGLRASAPTSQSGWRVRYDNVTFSVE